MVFRGKGSPFCESCCRRQIKCDEARPSCSQCVRAGLTCSGYRGDLELLFHDETINVSEKCKQLTRHNRYNRESKEKVASSNFESLSVICPAFDIDEAGRQYFLVNFHPEGFRKNMSSENIVLASPTSLRSLTSVGLVLMAMVRSDSHLMTLVQAKYTAALQALSRSIQNQNQLADVPCTAACLQLLVSEMFMTDGPDDIYSWSKHLGGLIALFRVLRIPYTHPSDTIIGCIPVIATITVGCLITLQPVPPFVVQRIRELQSIQEAAGSAHWLEFVVVSITLVNLYVHSRRGLPQQDDENLGPRLSRIDHYFVAWDNSTARVHGESSLQSNSRGFVPHPLFLSKFVACLALCRMLTQQLLITLGGKKEPETMSQVKARKFCAEIHATIPILLEASINATAPEHRFEITSQVFLCHYDPPRALPGI